MKYDVISFGSGLVDFFVKTGVHEKNHLISYPAGEKVVIKELRCEIGGGGTNTSVGFSRLGLKTAWIGGIGKDYYGKKILKLMRKENVKFLGKKDKENNTGMSIVLCTEEKDRTILTYKGANNYIDINDLSLRKIKTKWLYYSSLLGKSFETQKKLSKLKKQSGTKIAFNPSSYIIKEVNLLQLLKISEVLILNKEEAELLLRKVKSKEENLLRGLQKFGPRIIVITNGNKKINCYNKHEDKTYSLMPHNIKVVDPTGAGDAFGTGFIAGLIVGKNIEESLILGLRESESVLRAFGAKNNLLRMKLR